MSAVSGLPGISTALAAVLVSTLAGAIAMVLVFRLTRPRLGRFGAFALVGVTGCYITAPLYQAAYTESVALCFLAWTILEMRNHHYVRMYVPLVLLIFTRLISPPLAIAAAAHLFVRRRSGSPVGARDTALLSGYALLSLAGIALWPWIASQLAGSAGADRARAVLAAPGAKGWFGILWSVEPWSVIVPLVLAAWFVRLAISDRGRLGPELAAWAAAYPVFVLAVTPPTPGFLRYFMLAFPLSVGAIGSRDATVRRRLLSIAAVCVVMLVLQYLWLRFSFVVDPDPGEPLLNP